MEAKCGIFAIKNLFTVDKSLKFFCIFQVKNLFV